MNKNVGQHTAAGQRRRDPPSVGAAAIGQSSLEVVAPDGRLSLGVTDEKQSAHRRRLRAGFGIGKPRAPGTSFRAFRNVGTKCA